MLLPVPHSAADTLSRLSPCDDDDLDLTPVTAGRKSCPACRGDGGMDRRCWRCHDRGTVAVEVFA